MIRHYLKLIWNRKRTNLLIAIEIFFSFLVVFGVLAMATYYADNYRQPLGFSYDDVWAIRLSSPEVRSPGSDTPSAAIAETKRQFVLAAREFPEVRSAALAFTTPYGHSMWTSDAKVNGRTVDYSANRVEDAYAEAMGIRLVSGRWFNAGDDGVAWKPVVINERLAGDLFGAADPVGRDVPKDKPEPGEVQKTMRVVGVIQDFRQGGEYSRPENYMFERGRADDASEAQMMSVLVLRVKPGTTAAFEERLVRRLEAAAGDWSFEVEPIAEARDKRHKETLAPLIAAATVAGFLMLMVAMGLTGVLWQTVTQRTREVGLRRAKGATIPNIRAQILGELMAMASLAILAGAAIVLQFPLLKQLGFVTPRVYAVSLVISALCIYLLTLACAWYPSRLATAIPPAEALRYE
jgi:putative ABC transport system permease protein